MTAIEPTGQVLGATVRGVDLSKPLSDPDFATILVALGRHGVLGFPITSARSLWDRRLSAGRAPADEALSGDG